MAHFLFIYFQAIILFQSYYLTPLKTLELSKPPQIRVYSKENLPDP